MCKGQLLIKNQDGNCLFTVSSIEIEFFETGLDLTITCLENRDCNLGFLPAPKLYLENIEISENEFNKLETKKVEIPFGWETESGEEKETNIARIYIGQHQALNKNLITLEKIESNLFRVIWASESSDFNYYDDRAKNNKLELNCEFKNV